MIRFNIKSMTAIVLLGMLGAVSSCKKQATETQATSNSSSETSPRAVSAAGWDIQTDYNSRGAGYYSNDDFCWDHGQTSNPKSSVWPTDANRTKIENGNFVIKLLAGQLNKEGGLVSRLKAWDSPNEKVQFDVKFSDGFDFAKGGKVGFGVGVGVVATGEVVDGYTGVQRAHNGWGGSLRLMWYRPDDYPNAPVKFKPYAYFKEMGNYAGEPSDSEFPASGSIQDGVWYTIKLTLKMNTSDTAKDGYYIVEMGEKYNWSNTYKTYQRSGLTWATGSNRKVTYTLCDNFRGGNTNDYKSGSNGWIFLDNTKIDYFW